MSMMNILKLFKLDLKYYLLLLMPLLLVACDNSNPAVPVTLTGITISPSAVPDGLPIDVTQQFTATGSYSNNSKQDITKTVTLSSSAPAMATIDANGLATGVATGSTNITASLSGITSNTVLLNVINPNLVSLTVTPPSVPPAARMAKRNYPVKNPATVKRSTDKSEPDHQPPNSKTN